jgi:hypothetical protein
LKEKKEAVLDQAAAALGGLVGAGLGALAGSDGVAIGGAVGSVSALLVSKYAPEYFGKSLLTPYLSNRKIVAILKSKIGADLQNTFLRSQGDFDQAMISMGQLLKAASAQDSAIGTLEARLPRTFRWVLTRSQDDDEMFRDHLKRVAAYCELNGAVRVGCSSVCAATVAILRDLSARFANLGVRFDVVCDEINGRSFFDSLRADCELDFAVGPLEALVLSDEDHRLPLRLLGPLFGERQHVFVSTKKRIGFRSGAWVFDRSSAKFQYYLGLGIPRSAQEQSFDNARTVPELVESIPAGDMIIAWDPLASVLTRRKDYAIVHQSDYVVHFVLLGNLRVFRKNLFPLNDFLAVFVAEWRRRQRHQTGLVAVLRRDQRFMEAFALGAGHHWVLEV